MIHEINKEIWLETPKGLALAHFIIDEGNESHLKWVCFVQSSGEIWTFENPEVRADKNITLGRTAPNKPALDVSIIKLSPGPMDYVPKLEGYDVT